MKHIRHTADSIFFGASLCTLLIGFSLYYVKLAGIERLIVIRFTGGHGADFLGNASDALAMLFSGLIITVLNAFLVGVLHDKNPILARITGIITLFMTLLIVTALSCIIAVN